MDAGCHRPALLTSRSHPKNLREHGYRRALGEDGIEPVILEVPFHTDPAIRQLAVNECLNSVAEEIDAVFATDDLAAAEVLEWARLHNLTVPGDLRIIGFDGTQAIHRALPGLTTLRQPLDLIAHKAVEILLAQINGETGTEAHGLADASDASHDHATSESYEFPVTFIEGWTA
ncbi:Catabolite control protein [Chlamydia trachomatis]|nr:Catabolite control protein [Chlamydia trachomatis]